MAPVHRFHAARKRRDASGGLRVLGSAARWVTACFGSLYLAWVLLWPSSSGAAGRAVHAALFESLGKASYLLLPVMLHGLAIYLKLEKRSGTLTWLLGTLLCLASAAALLTGLGGLAGHPAWGGSVGVFLHKALHNAVGAAGTWLVALAAWFLGLQTLFEISWREASTRLAHYLAQDYQDWMRARRELKENIRSTAQRFNPPATQEPLIVEPPPQASAQARSASPKPLPPVITQPPEPEEPASVPPRAKARTGGREAHILPPLELLNAPATAATGPEESEIREDVESLERTLASFKLQAHVSGVVPGPVITRYEVSPSAGVTVSSIVARADDIALALKALRLRMIAPIPGKAAIGIEIPNHNPAGITLRQVLESKALSSRRSPLAFALGLSSDGTPAAADLQTLPHLLIAGATNSGKSVMAHALIQSILFRARPDEVKFLFIDPKRIELTLYEGIPHLYDPKTPCENVSVVTTAKEAARSLKALILVMESRYEKFQAYRVRDIEEYNRHARQEGRPTEFYIVVVIDELADLITVAKDVVEDSIQRLAQMARAVGIHLVLATQRPSVDIITGVIKANLPARIALRVASKIDSKVILDCNGAEALLGKGDMLYMAPGQDPVRIQGSFVSSEEISRVVKHLKAQGLPEYPALSTMAASGEEDLTKYGVEPMEFAQALQLVLERRRVSQDLLKSQFGSSARATNLLSLLEVKRFIHKPEGTNRWEINFDLIEEYLQARRAQGVAPSAQCRADS